MIPEIAGRIRRCAELVGSGDALSQKADIPRSTLETYLTGKAEPKASRLVAIAEAAGVSVQWLATGREPMRPDAAAAQVASVDEDLMARVAEGIALIYKEENARIYTGPLVRAAARMYDDLVASCDTPDERHAGLKAMLQQLRRQLREPPAADGSSGKQSA